MIPKKKCPVCGEKLEGRIDKKFCSVHCKSTFHYKLKRENEPSMFENIDSILKHNRRILKEYNKAGKATVRKETLLADGFNPKYFTHYWKAKNGNLYLFCYEFGFMEKTENNKTKYVLIQWQKYME